MLLWMWIHKSDAGRAEPEAEGWAQGDAQMRHSKGQEKAGMGLYGADCKIRVSGELRKWLLGGPWAQGDAPMPSQGNGAAFAPSEGIEPRKPLGAEVCFPFPAARTGAAAPPGWK